MKIKLLKKALSLLVIVFAIVFFIYPGIITAILVCDTQLRKTGECRLVQYWFPSVAHRYADWARQYLKSQYAVKIDHDAIAETEWPMFGSVFFLVTAHDLHQQKRIDASKVNVRTAVDLAAQVVASPDTAIWVRKKWGDDNYLTRENVFYRMLLILGLSSYEQITGDQQYHKLITTQRISFAAELSAAKNNMLDDYPGECYPSDVLWAVAALQRAAKQDGSNCNALAASLISNLDTVLRAREGVPSFAVDSKTGEILQQGRGCGNSGILQFAPELDPIITSRWYDAHARHFWKDTGWVVGFSEMPRASKNDFMDVDSGPVLFGFGSVASAFGIGAAKGVGRLDHAVPLSMEAIACSWPTPFGLLIPGLMGKAAVDGWCLGEVAILFSMTRPCQTTNIIPFEGRVPGIVYLLMFIYFSTGFMFIYFEIRSWVPRKIIHSSCAKE
jgi:hypothetical protein